MLTTEYLYHCYESNFCTDITLHWHWNNKNVQVMHSVRSEWFAMTTWHLTLAGHCRLVLTHTGNSKIVEHSTVLVWRRDGKLVVILIKTLNEKLSLYLLIFFYHSFSPPQLSSYMHVPTLNCLSPLTPPLTLSSIFRMCSTILSICFTLKRDTMFLK